MAEKKKHTKRVMEKVELVPFFKLGKEGKMKKKSRRWIYNRDSSLERFLRLVFPLQVGLAITAVLYT